MDTLTATLRGRQSNRGSSRGSGASKPLLQPSDHADQLYDHEEEAQIDWRQIAGFNSYEGLSDEEVKNRLELFGPNSIPTDTPSS